MKKIIAVLVLVLVAGCAAKPPKADSLFVDYDVVLKENSSEGLRLLELAKVKGVRDLTKEEFDKNKDDIEKMDAIVKPRGDINRLAYEAGGVGLGLAAGLSTGAVLGYGALTSLLADDRPDNYFFAWDFNSEIKIVNLNGVKHSDLLASAHNVANKADDLFGDFFKGDYDGDYIVKENIKGPNQYLERRGRKYRTYHFEIYYYAEPITRADKRTLSIMSFCDDGNVACIMAFSVAHKGKKTVLTTKLAQAFAKDLPDDYSLYLSPHKPFYRLPMIIRGGTGEIEYLVEK